MPKYTSEFPTKVGWYWVKSLRGRAWIEHFVQHDTTSFGGGKFIGSVMSGSGKLEFNGCQFAGPIEEPTE